MNLVLAISENSRIITDITDISCCVRDNEDYQIETCINSFLSQLSDQKSFFILKVHKEISHGELYSNMIGWREKKRQLFWLEDTLGFNISLIEYTKDYLPLEISIILSTCNQPEWLEKVLWGYEKQTNKKFEVIVADDGSRKETFLMLQDLSNKVSFQIKHVWQNDLGFRKCDILNKAILASQADYLLFSDGDCIPRYDFIQMHIDYRQPGYFLSGGYHKLNMDLSRCITTDDILKGNCFDFKWLKKHGMSSSFKNNKLTASGFKRWMLNTFTPTKPTWNGHNASGWLRDILAVNGFDERMKYGGQDREFGERLENAGIHGKQIRYSAICIHLDHPRGYKTQESIQNNLIIRRKTRVDKSKYTLFGIAKSE